MHAAPLHNRPIHAITLREAALFLAKVGEVRGITARNRVRSSLAAFYHWALREGLIETNPFANTNKVSENAPRERTPSLDELAEIWNAAGDTDYGQIVKLLMLTGARRDEIADLRWTEVDLTAGWTTLPPERTKNNRVHEIPITRPMAAILEPRHAAANGSRGQVFGRGQGGFQDFSSSKAELDQRILMARKVRKVDALSAWTLHDFRRSVSTNMHEVLGVGPHIVEACIGHVGAFRSGVAAVFNKARYRTEKRRAFELWNELLMTAVAGGANKIVQMRK
jgi:integrase